jgi:hypothetical protein
MRIAISCPLHDRCQAGHDIAYGGRADIGADKGSDIAADKDYTGVSDPGKGATMGYRFG